MFIYIYIYIYLFLYVHYSVLCHIHDITLYITTCIMHILRYYARIRLYVLLAGAFSPRHLIHFQIQHECSQEGK